MPSEAMQPPCVILCGPQMGENIGACARAMKNCGLSDLRLVDPRDGWPNPAANAMAAHAEDIVEAAQVFDTLEAAIADLPDGARAVLVLFSLEGYTHDEIAGLLGIATGSSKAQLHRARTLLKKVLA